MTDQPRGKDGLTDGDEGPTSGDASGRRRDGVTRRSVLRAGATGALGLFGATAAATAATDETETVDAVAAGADPTGEESIDGVLESVVGDDVVVEFPADGEFRVGGPTLRGDGFELRGNGARLVTDGGLLDVAGRGWRVDGFEIDQRRTAGYGRLSVDGGDYEVSRCVWRGQAGSAEDWAVAVRADPDTTAAFRDCYWADGAVDGGEESNFGCIGTFQDYTSGATLTFERCWFHGWSEDTIYASKPSVDLRLLDCYFHNTIVGPRVSDVTMRGCTCVNDAPIPREKWSGSSFQAGLWVDGAKGTDGEPLIADCDIYIVGPQGSTGIKAGTQPGPVTVRDTRIHDTENVAMDVGTERGDDITVENVTVSGNTTCRLGGTVRREDVTEVEEPAADPSPPIPEPPEDGAVPAGEADDGSDVITARPR